MKSFKQHLDEAGRCWPGYKPVPGKKKYELGSCTKEEVEQIDEISQKLAGSYYDAATKQHIKKVGVKPNMYGRIAKDMGEKRKQGVDRALDRLIFNRKTNEEVELQEGRTSQRHPLEGHDYHRKSDAELTYIGKDAHKAAEAMKGHNTTAENKYRDQANDSATVRYYRQKHGMQDWYKKKYGHMKEEVEELDEVAAWQRKEGKSEAGGLNRKGIESYRRENPGSKLSMAVTTKPSKLKAGSKAANRRKSFCSRMGGLKRKLTSSKTANDPNSRVNKALRKWNC